MVPVAAAAEENDLFGTSDWRLSKPATNGQIEGYTDRASAVPGTRVALKVSTEARGFHVEAYRFGWYDGGTARLVWASRTVQGQRQADPSFYDYSRRTVVARWQTSVRLPTGGWPAGAYVLKLVASDGWQAQVPYVVRSTSSDGRVALVAPITTWQAYNNWGGYSLYEGRPGDRRAWAVSFDRPYPAPGADQMLFGVYSVVVRAERLGIPLAYFTNVDVATLPDVLRGARGYVSMGHDEYWTPRMRRVVLGARDQGTNLAFLGADTMYWRIRLQDTQTGPDRVVIGYRSDAHLDPLRHARPALTTGRFRDPPVPQPEDSLTGVGYECYPVDAPYVVTTPGWWGFKGTHTTAGEEFPHLVGVEADRVYPVASTPRPLQILSNVRYRCGGIDTSAQSVYYTARSGAGVFTAGTLRWTCAMSGRCAPYTMARRTVRFTTTVTDNLLREFAQGPVGRRHPAHDNVDRFRLPAVNTVPAS
ncbi:MAG TPA: N,N-dimethylformamidase beta subunit family domain-containing protein [Nocardioidaceae bacterium]|nr:N,N-dimethylformamidase beta subunit family domain-containing protein [Nocardioidaceae bacterium]